MSILVVIYVHADYQGSLLLIRINLKSRFDK